MISRTKGGMNTKLHAVTEAEARPIRFPTAVAKVCDCNSAAAVFDSLQDSDLRLTDRGWDAD